MHIEVVGVVISRPLSNPLSVKKGLRVKNEIIIRLESLNTGSKNCSFLSCEMKLE